MALSKCTGSHQSWAVRKPKNAIFGADDIPIFDPSEAGNRLCQHWNIFRAREAEIPSDQAEMILSFVQPAPPD